MTERTRLAPRAPVRPAGPADAGALADLERDANLVALRHVFDPAQHAFPHAAVLARWRDLLGRPDVVVEVVDGPVDRSGDGLGLDALVAHDATRVRHLVTRPERWGQGLGGCLLERAAGRIVAGGRRPLLWCLADNHRARGLYTRRGWTPTGVERDGEFPPHPRELELGLDPGGDPGVGPGGGTS